MPIISMTGDQAKLCPPRDRLFMDTKTSLAFSLGQSLYHVGQSAAVDAPTGFHRSNPNGRGQMTFSGHGRAEKVQHFGAPDGRPMLGRSFFLWTCQLRPECRWRRHRSLLSCVCVVGAAYILKARSIRQRYRCWSAR